MPRTSLRQRLLNKLGDLLSTAVKHAMAQKVLGLSTVRMDELIGRLCLTRNNIQSKRHMNRGKHKKRSVEFDLHLETNHDDCMRDTEFRFHFRMSRATFWELVSLLEGHQSFQRKSSDSRGPLPKQASHQLLALSKCCGSEGNQCSSTALAHFFGVDSGVMDDCRKNALDALLSLEESTCIWPDVDERIAIAKRTQGTHLFPRCVGFIDGTLLPLASWPLLHRENCLSRKKFYAIVMLVVCDDLSRILYHHMGWPGSVHDNRVWRNCKLNKRPWKYFSQKQYLLGDSAFTASAIMIPPFKSTAGKLLSNNSTSFNTPLVKPRVKSEHCIGILKIRFPFLRGVRLRLSSKEETGVINDHVRGTVVPHNFLLDDEDWIDTEEMVEEGADDLEPEATTASNEPDHKRRDELFHYLAE